MRQVLHISDSHLKVENTYSAKYKNIGNRLVLLDYARWVFAFLVVVIHVPLVGKKFLSPIGFCAVPFFYMVTGYFLYDTNSNNIGNRIIKALKNYARIWIVAFSSLTAIVFCLKIIYSNSLSWSSQDFIDLLLIDGNCQAAELITINGVSYGTSALWFLYGGVISLALLLSIRRFLFRKVFFAIILVLYYVSISVNYKNGYVVPRILSASFIYLYSGIVLHKLISDKCSIISYGSKTLLVLAVLLIMGLYLEQLLFRCESYNRFLLLPTSAVIFMLIVGSKKTIWGG